MHTLGLQRPSKAEQRAAVSRSRHRLSGAEVRAVVMCVQQPPGAVHCRAWQRHSGFLEKSSMRLTQGGLDRPWKAVWQGFLILGILSSISTRGVPK